LEWQEIAFPPVNHCVEIGFTQYLFGLVTNYAAVEGGVGYFKSYSVGWGL
jgi:hypothetical protein